MKKIKILTIILFIIYLIPINSYALELDISSQHAILYNGKENKNVYEKNSKEKTSIASLTKITTAIVALEHIKNLDEKIVLTYKDFEGLAEANAAVAGFRIGQEVTYRDLLYGLLLPSGADAAQSLTRNIAGSSEEFVKLMNNKAKELKLENTHYVNSTGLDDSNHYSTVNDILIVLKYALENKDFKEMITTNSYTISDGSLTFKSTLNKTKTLGMDYIKGGKTGTTGDAGYSLATIANIDNTDFILITTKAEYPSTPPKSFLDQKKIYEYIRDNYDYQDIVTKGDKLIELDTKYLKEDTIIFKSPKTIKKYLENSFTKDQIKYKYNGKKIITSNMKKGEKLGRVDIVLENDILDTINIVLLEKPEFSLKKYLLDHKLIVIILVIVILLILIRLLNGKKKRRKIRIKKKKKK